MALDFADPSVESTANISAARTLDMDSSHLASACASTTKQTDHTSSEHYESAGTGTLLLQYGAQSQQYNQSGNGSSVRTNELSLTLSKASSLACSSTSSRWSYDMLALRTGPFGLRAVVGVALATVVVVVAAAAVVAAGAAAAAGAVAPALFVGAGSVDMVTGTMGLRRPHDVSRVLSANYVDRVFSSSRCWPDKSTTAELLAPPTMTNCR